MTINISTTQVPTTNKFWFNMNRTTSKKDFLESLVVGIVLTILSYGIAAAFGWYSLNHINYLEIFAVITSYVCTYLCIKERRINYPIGAVSSFTYAILFLQSDLLASAVLNFYLVPTLIYGWLRWGKDINTRKITHLSFKSIPVYVLVSVAFWAGAALLSSKLGGTTAWTDSVILVGTILAQFMLDNKKLENWIVWAVVNIFAIYTYFHTGLYLVGVQYIFFLLNTVYAFYVWFKSMKNDENVVSGDVK